jgi:hypothetical protein
MCFFIHGSLFSQLCPLYVTHQVPFMRHLITVFQMFVSFSPMVVTSFHLQLFFLVCSEYPYSRFICSMCAAYHLFL